MQIKPTHLDELVNMAHADNPKEHDIDALITSIQRFGFVAPPTIDEATSTLVAGHGRVLALVQMRAKGLPPPTGVDAKWRVPVVRGIAFRSKAERDAYLIADNQHVMAGGWDLDKLMGMLGSLDDFGGLGFSTAELSAFGIGDAPQLGDEPPHAVEGNEPPDKPVKHSISVATTYTCPNCGHEWKSEE